MTRDQQLSTMRQQEIMKEMQHRVWRSQVRNGRSRPSARVLRVLRLRRS
ncbi:MAG: hypothetical protein H0X59_09600 [Chloroflexi bacterium]|nr:hypothetical protein [Chloroflexota bacterium]